MARPIWTGTVSFGLVAVPVGLYPATEDHTVHFTTFQRGTADRIRYRRVNERTGDQVEYSDTVRGVEVGGEVVTVSPEELEGAEPGRSHAIEICDFVSLAEVDPVYFQKSYYLAPNGRGAARPYALLREAMRRTGKAAIATLVLRAKQYLVTVRPLGETLTVSTMFFADEVRDPAVELPQLPDANTLTDRELAAAEQLITSLATQWHPGNYHDSYRERVEALLETKRTGRATPPAPASTSTKGGTVVDLMSALQASVAAARQRRDDSPKPRDRAPARPPAATPATPRSGAKPRSAAGARPAAELTKAELLTRAAMLEIPRRSSMRRDELAAAVAAAQRRRPRSAAS